MFNKWARPKALPSHNGLPLSQAADAAAAACGAPSRVAQATHTRDGVEQIGYGGLIDVGRVAAVVGGWGAQTT